MTDAPTPPRRFRLGLPELLSALAVVGIGAVLYVRNVDEAGPPPPDAWRCGTPVAWPDCFQRVQGATIRLGAQSTDEAAPNHDPDAQPNEGPVREVRVASFWIQKTEATVGAYRRCVKAGACDEAEVEAGGGFSTYHPASEPDDPLLETLPVNSVTWKGASDLCAWLGGRLPAEAEWELAARGTDARRWPWGNVRKCPFPSQSEGFARLEAGDATSCQQDGPVRADDGREVGPDGIIGMAGNVWEWTLDDYVAEGAAPGLKAQRGGGWTGTTPAEVRTTVRGGLDPSSRLNDVGFRCVLGGEAP